MTTSSSTPARAAKTLRGASSFTDQLVFETENEPNADILLRSLRSAGYSLEFSIGDFIDNCIDAGATAVVINLSIDSKTKDWTIDIADDGRGMDRETLDQMMRLGSRTPHDPTTDLGAFGLGSDTAALAMGRRKHVITSEDSHWLSGAWDLAAIEKTGKFVKHLGDATADERSLFAQAFATAKVDIPQHGTLVRIDKCDRVGRQQVKPAEDAVLTYIGKTFRRFLIPNGGMSVWVNGRLATPIDPMMRENRDTTILLDEQIDFSWKDSDGEKHVEKLGFLVVHLPDFGGHEANLEKGISGSNSGYYVLRNGREIAAASSLRLYTKHNEWGRFRCEVSIPAALDSQMGLTFLKSTTELHLAQALRDKIEHTTVPYRRQSRKLYKTSRPDAKESVPHDEAAKQIKSRSPLLRKPDAEIEKRKPPTTDDNLRDPKTPAGEGTTDRTPRTTQRSLADEAEFAAKHEGVHAPFYSASLVGRKITVTYNADHPAYQRLILENRENRALITAIDYLIYSLASAELRNISDADSQFVERMREDMSYNLRQLLTT